MNYIKLIFTIIVLSYNLSSFSQISEIEKILNDKLEKEADFIKKHSKEYYGDQFEIIQGFHIQNDTLSVEIKIKPKEAGSTYFIEKREVSIHDIQSIEKDINILFVTESNAVKITRTDKQKHIETYYSDLFFTCLSAEKSNEYLGDELVEAFKKAGYTVRKGEWWD